MLQPPQVCPVSPSWFPPWIGLPVTPDYSGCYIYMMRKERKTTYIHTYEGEGGRCGAWQCDHHHRPPPILLPSHAMPCHAGGEGEPRTGTEWGRVLGEGR